MMDQNLAIRLKDLRIRKGYSQEQLSEEAKISLRTVQRIEKGTSVPRGDTLLRLTAALGVTPDDLLDWTKTEDRGFLSLLNISALGGLLHPILGIILPLVMWILKREKVHLVDETGKNLINFMITWVLLFYLLTGILSGGPYLALNIDFLSVLTFLISDPLVALPFTLLYLYVILMVFINIRRNRKGRKSSYFPAVPFLR